MDEDELGETVAIDVDFEEVIDTPDGGAIIVMEDDDEEAGESDFYDNLAETLPEGDMARLASSFLDLISRDKEARKKRDEQYEEGLKRTGLGNDAPGGADFEGATKVVHPMMTEACIDFAARAMKEIFPPSGPAKDNVVAPITPKKLEKAERKTRLLNWQMTVQCPDFRAELEQLITQVPMGGTQYLKLSWDAKRNRPTPMFAPVDDILLPYAATNFYSSQRKTQRQYLTQLDFEERVKSGMYRDVDLAPAGMEPEQTESGKANDKIEGRSATSYNEDGLRVVFEVYATADIEGEGPAPYIISIDDVSRKVLAIYRNWEEDDEYKREIDHFVEWPFIPWRGAYAIGLPHIIGSLSGAATGALRALLDSAHVANSMTMVKLKGGINGQSVKIRPGETAELEGGLNVDDVRKLAMPLPYPQPSPVLFQLLGFLVDAGKNVTSASLDGLADGRQDAPVGTTLALIEQGAVVYSSIHARLHDAMSRTLRILDRLNGKNLDEERLEREAGELIATREDFDGALDVVPVSDPNIFSETQRYAQVQAVAQRAALLPQLYNARKVEERLLATLKIPNAEDLLNPPVEPREQNAVNENVAASLGRPITAFPEQDHIAHLKTHLAFLTSPAFGMNPLIAPDFLPGMLNHIREHMVMWYVAATVGIASDALGEDVSELMRDINEEPEAKQELDRMLAEASTYVIAEGATVFDQLPPVIQQAQQMMQQIQQMMQAPMPVDPRIELEGKKIELQGQKLQADAQQAQIDSQTELQKLGQAAQEAQQKFQLAAQKMAADQQLAGQKLLVEAGKVDAQREQAAADRAAEDARVQAELAARAAMNSQDNQTAKDITAAKIAAGDQGNLQTGTGIDPNPGGM